MDYELKTSTGSVKRRMATFKCTSGERVRVYFAVDKFVLTGSQFSLKSENFSDHSIDI